ncbi:hypothetical protein MW290_00580 [Aquincola tertiaricarbonis]|uniref:Uncharacterized protein n=1 Tax=Aquincola tertiaricarbonis TaxID=391953 RepID=A0ABY4S4L1_AQUTE|nr:hypothetical protein [Aquincola tertiaricarbonis]URI07155.1 hypothetical protein MW290_00580 [Aquincola tertiaricarbonis]
MDQAPAGASAQVRAGLAAGLLVLVFAFTLALAVPVFYDKPGTAFWFVGLLVIFGAALALIAMVFHALGLASADEAFGLPAGSLRSLLAVGVMVLFAVFGLQALMNDGAGSLPGWQLFSTTVADVARVQPEIQRYEKQGLLAIAGAASGPTGIELRIYSPTRTTPAATQDIQKQIITALITLVTSVVSFYFGSRSVEAMAKATGEGKGGGGGGGAGAVPGTVTEGIGRLDEGIAKAEARLAALRAEPPDPNRNLAGLEAQLKQLKADRSGLEALVKDVAAGSATAEQASQRLQALRAQLARLEQSL